MKTLVYTRTAATALRKHANRAASLRSKIESYARDPLSQANNVKALTGVDALRLRAGNFRILFTESDDRITILDIGPRGGIYD